MWSNGDIKCRNPEFIKKCLGLTKFTTDPLRQRPPVSVDHTFISNIVSKGYKMVVKRVDFFKRLNVEPFSGMVVISDIDKRMYCMEESVTYLREQCQRLQIELVQEDGPEPTYFFRPKV
jgi:hypothetical protein